MQSTYLMPTRIVLGEGLLAEVGQICANMGLRHMLVVTDRNITPQPFYRTMLASLDEAGIRVHVYDGCGIDAHLDEVDTQAAVVREKGIDGVIGVGGGSVMCAAKAIAIVARNPPTFRDCAGIGRFSNRALPMAMVPTTAGSGAEVSQFTLVKDDARGEKFVGGGPLSFPDVALLDPSVLSALPPRLAAVSAVDALTHAVEALFTEFATPLTDALALSALGLLVRAIPEAISTRAHGPCLDNLLGSSMANMACGNARLGLAHALSLPLESQFHLAHGLGVGVLLPHVLAFNAPAAPDKVRLMAGAMGIEAGRDEQAALTAVLSKLYALYAEIGFPKSFGGVLDRPPCLRAVAEAAVPGLYGVAQSGPITSQTVIASPNLRHASVADAERIYAACFG